MDEQDGPEVGLTGARFGGRRRRRPRAEDDATQALTAIPPDVAVPPPQLEPPPEPSSLAVRPYVLTRGRTRSRYELAIETLVSAVPAATGDPGTHGDIVELCREPRSVAEVAALRGVPLGVAKVVLGDLAEAGVIAVHRTADAAGPGLALMRRVLGGLRRL
jgi:Protein of unknown function (DUF742)